MWELSYFNIKFDNKLFYIMWKVLFLNLLRIFICEVALTVKWNNFFYADRIYG